MGFPGGSAVKNLPAKQETQVRSLGWEDPQRRKWQPTPVFLSGKSHGRRNLVGYGPRGLVSRVQCDWTVADMAEAVLGSKCKPHPHLSLVSSIQGLLALRCYHQCHHLHRPFPWGSPRLIGPNYCGEKDASGKSLSV